MARKIIVDSVKYLVKTFDIDGFRFDLMGLMDIETMNQIYSECKKIKSDLMFYGEGWNIDTPISFEKRACSDNASKLLNYGFFNDMFRDIVKGPTFADQLYKKGFINGDFSYHHGLVFSMLGSVCNSSYEPRYKFAHQSINYIECHDNNTLYDKLFVSNENESEETLLQRVKLANAILLLSYGVPFIHMGQEVGQTKFGLDNTYNIVKVNNMDWQKIDTKFDMVLYFKKLVKLRKLIKHLDKPEDIEKVFEVSVVGDNILKLTSKGGTFIPADKEAIILINNEAKNKYLELDSYYGISGIPYEEGLTKRVTLGPCSLTVLYKL